MKDYNILVVDDDEMITEALKYILKMKGIMCLKHMME